MKPDQERPEEYKMRLEIALKAAKRMGYFSRIR